MKNTDIQDLEENLLIQDFLGVYPVLGIVQQKEKNQKPDVIINQGNSKLGIELCELHSIDTEKFGSQREMGRTLQKIIQTRIEKIIRVQVLLNNDLKIKANEKKQLAEIMFNKIIDHMNAINSINIDQYVIEFDDKRYGKIKLFIRSGIFNGTQWLRRSKVQIVSVGWVIKSFDDQIFSVIDTKNVKFEEYKKRVDDCWLLIYSNVFKPLGFFDFSSVNINRDYGSKYTKTFLYENGNKRYYELK